MGASRATVGRLTINAAPISPVRARRQSLGIGASSSVQIGSSVCSETRDAQNHQLPTRPQGEVHRRHGLSRNRGTSATTSTRPRRQPHRRGPGDRSARGNRPPGHTTRRPGSRSQQPRATIESAGYTAATDLYQTSSVSCGGLRSSARQLSRSVTLRHRQSHDQGPITFAPSVCVGGK